MPREHLFISYATEDWPFAQWLAHKLTGEGFSVWCDRFKLLGGESYPRDIDTAIKTEAFRVLAVLSRNSLTKPNPVKERTLALNLARERGETFLIPLNLDGLRPAELDWMTSDLTFIPFEANWAEGLRQTLKCLDALDAPRPLASGRRELADLVNSQNVVVHRHERLWANVIQATSIPSRLIRVSAYDPIVSKFEGWPHVAESSSVVWVLETPPTFRLSQGRMDQIDWQQREGTHFQNPRIILTNLLRQYLKHYCRLRGLRITNPDRSDAHFPQEIGNDGWISYTMASGRKSRIRVAGTRNFKRAGREPEVVRYSLSLNLRPALTLLDEPCVVLLIGLQLADARGNAFPPGVAFRRERKIRKSWWNKDWLARLTAAVEWLRGEHTEIILNLTPSCRLSFSGTLSPYDVNIGIDEQRLAPSDDAAEPESHNESTDIEDEEDDEYDA